MNTGKNSHRSQFQTAVALTALIMAGTAAQAITVPNYSFESQTAPNSSPFVNINVDSWQKNPEPSFYQPTFGTFGIPWVGTAGVFLDNSTSDSNPYANKVGNQLGYILAAPQVALFQDSTTGFDATYNAGNTYTMTVGVFGRPTVAPGSTLEVFMYYLDDSNNKITVGSTTITYSAGAFTATTPNNLIDFSATTPAIQAGDAAAGKNIGIEIESTVSILGTSFGNWDLDNVRLTENPVVPEPTTIGLMTLGLGGLLMARARRRA